jgi:hypothetical protein
MAPVVRWNTPMMISVEGGGCNHIITPADITVKDCNIVQSVFEEFKEAHNVMAIIINSKGGRENSAEVLSLSLSHCNTIPWTSYQKHIFGNELREKLLEWYNLSQAASKALEEWNAKKTTGEDVVFDYAFV